MPSGCPKRRKGGFADSNPLQLFVARMVKAIHDPPLGHGVTTLKDLDTVLDVARKSKTPVPMTGLTAQLPHAAGPWWSRRSGQSAS